MERKRYGKKLAAPIAVTAILVLYYLGFAAACLLVPEIPAVAKLLCGIVPLVLVGVCIYVLVERIKEIRSGEEDDLSQY